MHARIITEEKTRLRKFHEQSNQTGNKYYYLNTNELSQVICITTSVPWFNRSLCLMSILIDWLSMVLRLRQHNIGYTADGFYRSDDPTNSVKALKEGG